MSCTTSRTLTTRARCLVITNVARGRNASPETHTAPFSATANAPGSTASPSPSRPCGSEIAERSTRPGTPSTADPIRPAPSSAASAATATASVRRATGSSQRTPTRERSGAGAAGGDAFRSASRMRRRLSTGAPSGACPRTSFAPRSGAGEGAAGPTPGLAEALDGRRGQLPAAAPDVPRAVEEEAREPLQREAEEAARGLVARAAPEEQPDEGEAEPLARRDEAASREGAPLPEERVVDGDADRADGVARAAERGRERERRVRGGIAGGGEGGADRARHHPAVAVAAAAPVDGTGVEAGAAADAGEEPAHRRVREEARAPVVDHDDVQLAARHRPVEVRGVRRDRLARGRAREEPDQDREVLEARDDLLDAHAGDVHGREGGAHVGVPLVRADHHAAGLRHREIHAGEPRLRAQEALAQVAARRLRELRRIGEPRRRGEFLVEELADLLALQVDRRKDDVRGRLVPELHDPLAEVGVHDLDPARLEVGVEAALLGEHRLRLHEPGDPTLVKSKSMLTEECGL